MRWEQAAKKLGRIVQQRGYKWKLDKSHPHPRLIIYGDNPPAKRYVLLSSTQSYSHGQAFNIKKQDLARTLREMPKQQHRPRKMEKQVDKQVDTAAPAVMAHQVDTVEDLLRYPLKIYILGSKGGKGGALAINVPQSALKAIDRERCSKVALDANRNMILFFGYTGKQASKTKNADTVRFVFRRDELDFQFTEKLEGSGPVAYARVHGQSLVTTKSVPQEILTGVTVKGSSGGRHSLDEGKVVREMFNDWLHWAKTQGHDPQVTVENGLIKLFVAEKRMKEL